MSANRTDQGIREFERDGPLVTLPRYVASMETYQEPTEPRRWFCVYRSDNYMERGVRVQRLFGGKNNRCYHDLEVVLHVARKWMPARPDAQAFVYEAFPLEGDPPIGARGAANTLVHESPTEPAETREVTVHRCTWRWTKTGQRTRLVLLETLVQPMHRVVQLTEELIARGHHVGERSMFAKRSARDPTA